MYIYMNLTNSCTLHLYITYTSTCTVETLKRPPMGPRSDAKPCSYTCKELGGDVHIVSSGRIAKGELQ